MFKAEYAQDPIDFIEMTKLTGDFYGQPFHLIDWQKDVLSQVYGNVDENGRRLYKRAYLEIPKKNGKTELVASLALYHCLMDEPGGQIYCCAAERDQASLTYMAAKSKIEQNEYLDKAFRVVDSQKVIYNRTTGTFIKVLSAEAYSKHGLNPSVVIFDELHALQKRDLWDVMTFGTGAAREEQLIWIITTAGDDPDRKSVGWEQHDYARKIIDGEIENPTWFARIYGAPEDADIYDEATWRMANPSLGVTISIENVREEALEAKNSPSREKLFRWLRLNQWVALKRVAWLPITLWDETESRFSIDEMNGEECYMGLDLSSTTDLTGIAFLFPPRNGRKWRFFLKAFIPSDNVQERERRDHVPFTRWIERGSVIATPGNCVDYGELARYIEQMMRKFRVKYIAADEWRITSLQPLMENMNIDMRKVVTIPQNMSGMTPGMRELERMLYAGEIEHNIDPMGRWTFGNVVTAMDGNENIKPMKQKSFERIDPMCALIDAMSAAVRFEPKGSAYETHGIRTL